MSSKVKWLLTAGICILATFMAPISPLFAKSTTSTSIAVLSGKLIPGHTVILRATVSGKHVVYTGGGCCSGGNVELFDSNGVFARIPATSLNSTNISGGCDAYGCVYTSTLTTVNYQYTVPATNSGGYYFSARYTGDPDSNSSNANPITPRVYHPTADLYQIGTHNTGTHSTEAHILDAKTNYTTYKLHTGTALGEVNSDNWSFAVGDYNGDDVPDLYAINKSGGATGSVEVHILNGADNFRTFLLHIGIPVEESTGQTWQFDLGYFNNDDKLDLYAIRRAGTGTRATEVHVFDGANNFQTALLHTGTVLGETGSADNWEFHVGDYNNDGHPDVYAILKTSATTEVHILDGATNFNSWLLETTTGVGPTGSDAHWVFDVGDYNGDGKIDWYAINKVEPSAHVVDAGNFQSFLLHQIIPTGNLGTDHSAAMALPK